MSLETLDVREVVRRVVDDARERLAADAVALWLRGADGSELTLSAAIGFRERATTAQLTHRPSGRLADWLGTRRLPAVLTVRPKDTSGERAWLAAEAIHSLLAVPLPGDVTSLGILAAFRRRRPFPVGYLARAAGMAVATAPALHAAQRVEAQRQRAERAETLLDIAHVLAAGVEREDAMDAVARRTARAVGAERCVVRLSPRAPTAEPAAGALVVRLSGVAGPLGTLALEGPPRTGWTPAVIELAAAVGDEIARAADVARRSPAELSAAQAELVQREALRALANLASGAAHHLNNLLTIVVGRVQLVLRSTEDERVLHPLTIVEKAAKDAADVVRRLHEFSQIRPLRQPRPVRIDHLLSEIHTLSHRRWPRSPLNKVDVDSRVGEVPPIAGDAAALREALGHIIANAMDAMPTGGRLLIETRASATSVSVTITDSGPGMSEAIRRRALEPFFTTKGEKATGLGLSVAYGVVRSHGGDLAIRSAEGAGTTVTLTLPRSEPARGVEP